MPGTSSAQREFDYVKKAHKALDKYTVRHNTYAKDKVDNPDLKARRDVKPLWIYDPESGTNSGGRLPPAVVAVLRPQLKGAVAKAFPVNYDFKSRAAMNIVAMHTELEKKICSFGGVATAIISSDNELHSNKDLGGIAEQYMDLDQVVIPARDHKGTQTWDMDECKQLIAACRKESLVRVFRQHTKGYRYSGLYRVVDSWRTHLQYRDPRVNLMGSRTCFFKLERVPTQEAVEPVSLVKAKTQIKKDVRSCQLHNSIVTLQGKGKPEFCANCLIDGNGRNDIYECDGCAARLATNPKLPAACVRNGCSNRTRKCIHTVPKNICPECVSEKDEAFARQESSSWCCAECADFYGLWKGRPRCTRGLFMAEKELCKVTKRPPAAQTVLLSKTPEQKPVQAAPRIRMTAATRKHMAMERAFERALLSGRNGTAAAGAAAGPSLKRKRSVDEAGPSNTAHPAHPSRRQEHADSRWQFEDQHPKVRGAQLRAELLTEAEASESIAPTEVQDLVDTEDLDDNAANGEAEVQQPQRQPAVMIKQEVGGASASVAAIAAVLLGFPELNMVSVGQYLGMLAHASIEERQNESDTIHLLATGGAVVLQPYLDAYLLRTTS